MSTVIHNPLPDSAQGLPLHSAIKAAIDGQEGCSEMARRRYQRGSLSLVGTREKKWQLRWREDVILPSGERARELRKEIIATQREARTQREAWRIAEQRLSHINDRNYRPQVRATFREFAADWEKTVLAQKKPSYQATEKARVKRYLLPAFGDKLVGELCAYDVQRLVASLAVGAKTKRNVISTLRSLFRSAKAWNLTQQDWFAGLVMPEWIKPEARHFTATEAQRIVAAAPEPLKTWLWLLAVTGARLGEVCALTPADFHFEERVVVIRRSAWHGKHVGSTKSKRPRVVRIGEKLAEHMREFVKGKEPNDYIFARKDGTPWYGDKVVNRKLRPLLLSLGISPAGAHAFRHMNASLMDQLRVPDKVRADRLGHVDFGSMTLGIYSHADSRDHDAVAMQLDEMLAPTAAGTVQ